MKKSMFWMVLATTALMLTACGGKTAKSESEDEKSETAAVQEEMTGMDEEDDSDVLDGNRQIDKIRQAWASQTIATEGKNVNIGMLAKAFCKQYADYQPNKVLLRYLNGEKNYNEGLPFEYNVNDMTSNGYLRCLALLQYDMLTECCYWNRNNGHKLVAFWLSATFESSTMDRHLAAFYDYDPATGIMTPEPKLTEMIEQTASQYDAYTIQLPDEGKDIMIYDYTINYEDDSAESKNYALRWNGYDFKLEEVKAE